MDKGVAPAIDHPLELKVTSRGTSVSEFDVDPRESALGKMLLLWENRQWLYRITLCALLASTLIAFVIPKRYTSTARLMPPDPQSGNGMAMVAALSARTNPSLGGLAGDLLGVRNSGALFVGIMQSRTVADRIISQFQLSRIYHVSNIEDARDALANHTNIGEDRKSGIITVSAIDHDPERAAKIAQAYVDELDHLVAQVSTSSARRERVFLEERLRDVKHDLDAVGQKFSEFASKNSAIDIPAQGKAMVEAAATLQGELIAAESELRGLEQIYTEQNVRVRSLHARVAELDQQLNKLGTGDEQNGPSLYPSIRKLPLLGVTYADLYRQLKIQETVYELLTQQYELAKVQEAKEIPTVKVLDVADVPTKKSFPSRLMIIFLGTSLGLVSAGAYVFGRNRWDAADPNDPWKVFAQEVFASLTRQIQIRSSNSLASHSTEIALSDRDSSESRRRF